LSLIDDEEKSNRNERWSLFESVLMDPSISLGAKVVFAIVFLHSNPQGIAWPGYARIANAMGLTERRIREYMGELKKAGILEIQKRQHKTAILKLKISNRQDISYLNPDRTDTAGLEFRQEEYCNPNRKNSVVENCVQPKSGNGCNDPNQSIEPPHLKDLSLKDHPEKSKQKTETCVLPGEGTKVEPPTIEELLSKYTPKQQKTITAYWIMIRRTRKTGKLADNIIRVYMDKWAVYPADIVIQGMKTHLERYPGKREEYTHGIIRNIAREEKQRGANGANNQPANETRASQYFNRNRDKFVWRPNGDA
jgi:hypothetical protein